MHYRTHGGAEIDLVLEKPSGEVMAVEIQEQSLHHTCTTTILLCGGRVPFEAGLARDRETSGELLRGGDSRATAI